LLVIFNKTGRALPVMGVSIPPKQSVNFSSGMTKSIKLLESNGLISVTEIKDVDQPKIVKKSKEDPKVFVPDSE